jgi:hypothetical protein
MGIPDKVNVNGVEYKIKETDDLNSPLGDNWGLTEYKSHTIYLRKEICDLEKLCVLWHECIHIVNDNFKIGLDETNVARFEHGLFQVLQDNKGIFS